MMRTTKQRVLMLDAPGHVRFADRPLPSPGPRDVVLRPAYSTLKHGTEMLAYRGRNPLAGRSFDPGLRLFEPELEPQQFYPRPMGNMVAGTIEWAGSEVTHLQQKQTAYAWAPIADLHVLPADSVLPLDDLTPEQALCIDPASFALGAVIDGGITPADSVLVTGLGAIGLFVIQYCAALGAKVLAASSIESRRRLAESFRADAVYDPRTHADLSGDLARTIKQQMGGVTAAIECSGTVATLNLAIRAVRQCGRVVCVGFYGTGDGAIDLGGEFYHNRLTLLASLPAYSWNNPVRASPALYAKDLQQMAARDFRQGKITPAGLLAPTMPFQEADRAIKLIADDPERVVKLLVQH